MAQRQRRQLAAILFTDMSGYTALMAKDEVLANQLRIRHRKVLNKYHKLHNGEILQYFGDGTLSIFPSALEAVDCAVNIQLEFQEDPKVPLRVGIHSGEVVWDDEGIYGSAVNIASRLESFAETGSVLISAKLQGELENHKSLVFQSLGLFELKNVPDAMEVFAVSHPGLVMPDKSTIKGKGNVLQDIKENNLSFPEVFLDKNLDFHSSIAVLPFEDLSPKKDQEYLCDGLADEVITDLSGLRNIKVICRNSSIQLKGTQLSPDQISTKLGVRYLLTGGIRQAGDQLRITAQLVDAENSMQIWAERFKGSTDEIFDLQENISQKIVGALNLKLNKKEEQHLEKRPIGDVRAYDAYLKARREIYLMNEEALERAEQLINNAIQIIGPNDVLFSTKGYIHLSYIILGLRPDNSHLEIAEKYLDELTHLNPSSSYRYFLRGMIRFKQADIQQAIHDFKKVLQYDPNNRDTLLYLPVMYILAGYPAKGTALIERLIALDPLTALNHAMPGYIELSMGNLEKALKYYQKGFDMDPNNPLMMFTYCQICARVLEKDQIISVLKKLEVVLPNHTFSLQGRFLRLTLEGKREEALNAAENELLQNSAKWDEHTSWWLSTTYALLNEKEKALEWLQRAISLGYCNYPLLSRYDPFLDNIRGEERFKQLMGKVKRKWEQFDL
jgi:non-specific serine/threonine protein kinase